jgi:hypothetical protein
MSNLNTTMRVYHRYLGFFLAGIMAVYALSGVVMIFRDTDFLKVEQTIEKTLPKDIKTDEIGKEIRMRDFKADKEENGIVYFKNGTFDRNSGIIKFTKKDLPFILGKMEKMHKSTTKDPLFFLNIFFGLSLLFFVVSSFWMFIPKSAIFKKGLYFTIAGVVLTLILIFI